MYKHLSIGHAGDVGKGPDFDRVLEVMREF